jgi:CBS domain-containing protein
MISLAQLRSVELDAGLEAAVAEMSRGGAVSLPVVANGHILGTISREDVTWFLKRAQALQAA